MSDYFNGRLDAGKLAELQREHLWLHMTNHRLFETREPPIMVEGAGFIVKDIDGREYIDGLSGGVWAVNVGYGRESIVQVISEQLRRLPYYAGSMATPPYILLAQKLASLLPDLPKVYISNSGSEANEKSFKIARQYFREKYRNDKYKIIYRNRDYHGTTLAALASSGQQERKLKFGPLPEGFAEFGHALCYRCQFGRSYPGCSLECARDLETVILQEGGEDSVAAVIVEPVTAGGGIIPPVAEYYQVLEDICRKYDVLLIMDEVVNGFGRTGKMFGFQHYQAEPDMITLAKGLASGYMPIAATVARQKIFAQFLVEEEDKTGYFRDISTFGGCAAASAAAVENINIIEKEKLAENSAAMGAYLMAGLRELAEIPVVGEVRGKGLLAGIELVTDKKSKQPLTERHLAQVVADAKTAGVIIGRMVRSVPGFNNVLYTAPPLIIDKEGIDRIVKAFRGALEKLQL